MTTWKELQLFLGFANFYRRFIKGFSSFVSPLHTLTSYKSVFQQSPSREKVTFTTAPVLTVSNPANHFIVEVDASNVGIGTVLSQRLGKDGKLHP